MKPLDEAEKWLELHGSALYSYALLQTRDEHHAEDLLQETLVAALQAREKFSGTSSTRTWLIGILKHKIIDLFRLHAREFSFDEPPSGGELTEAVDDDFFDHTEHWKDALTDWKTPERELDRDSFLRFLQFCLEHLPPRVARLFLLRELMEETTEIICKELAITPTNLWTMLHRARLSLRQCLDKNWMGQTAKRQA